MAADNEIIYEADGRGTLSEPFVVFLDDVQQDLSAAALFLEVSEADLRRPLAVDPEDPKARIIYLSNADVALLPTKYSQFRVRNDATEKVILSGKIIRVGFKDQPNG